MSHAVGSGGGGGEVVEPNLTPMLDLVLQLLMFFIMITRFSGGERSPYDQEEKVRFELPIAQTAMPITKVDKWIFVTLDRDGHVVASPWDLKTKTMDLSQFPTWIEDRAKDNGTSEVIILKADSQAEMRAVWKLMEDCRNNGFKEVRIRGGAKTKSA